MTAIAHVQLLDALLAVLSTPQPAAPWIQRMSTRALPESVASGVALRLRGGPGRQIVLTGAPRQWQCLVEIECMARATASQAADAAVGPLLDDVHARLLAASQPGGALLQLGYQITEDLHINWDAEAADERIGAATLSAAWTWRSAWDSLAIIA